MNMILCKCRDWKIASIKFGWTIITCGENSFTSVGGGIGVRCGGVVVVGGSRGVVVGGWCVCVFFCFFFSFVLIICNIYNNY